MIGMPVSRLLPEIVILNVPLVTCILRPAGNRYPCSPAWAGAEGLCRNVPEHGQENV